MELITIRRFDNAIDAYIVKAHLEEKGITGYIFDEHIVTLVPLYNVGVGGIKLKISENDREKALEVLAELDRTPLTNQQDEAIHCPNCGSTELNSGFKSMRSPKGVLAAIVSFLLSVFPIYYETVYCCRKCGKEVKPVSNSEG